MTDILLVFVRDDDSAKNAERKLHQHGYSVMVVLRIAPMVPLLALLEVRIAYLSRLLRAKPERLRRRYGWDDIPLVIIVPRAQRPQLIAHHIFPLRLL